MESTTSTNLPIEEESCTKNEEVSEDVYVKQCIHAICDEESKVTNVLEEYVQEEGSYDTPENIYEDIPHVASEFTDAECGEPMYSQRLIIDFNPVEGVDDNAQLQKKCSDFWQFVYNEPRLQKFMVLPEKLYEEVVSKSSSETSLMELKNIKHPAIDWLDTGVGHNIAFAVKHQTKFCADGDEDYMDGPATSKRHAPGRSMASVGKEDDDKDFEKCISFWKKINDNFGKDNLKVASSVEIDAIEYCPDENVKDIVNRSRNYDNIDGILCQQDTNKVQQKHCVVVPKKFSMNTFKTDLTGHQIRKDCKALTDKIKLKSSPRMNVGDLCTQMEEWDKKHPKSMKPPGRVPPLTHAIMQRKTQER